MTMMMKAAERGLLPQVMVRYGIRRLLKMRLQEIAEKDAYHREGILEDLQSSPLAVATDKANEQHYELPSSFFEWVLGDHLKYSSAFFATGRETLSQAEKAMLELYLERGQFVDGMNILELGCGWGSLTLYLAQRFSQSKITAISNSQSQRQFIEKKLQERNLHNVTVVTCDINDFSHPGGLDRIVSIEMFEHVRNYPGLFERMASWLGPEGKVFIHIFCHAYATYLFETEGEDNWMGRYFFTGGVMPSFDLFERIQNSLVLEKKWQVDGRHYQQTAEAWFSQMDLHRGEIMPLLASTYGADQATIWFWRWKIFFAACAELFGYHQGKEWFVGHYLFRPRS